MFTGIIAEVGRVHKWQLKRGSGVLIIKSHLSSKAIGLGSSVAVNGACLTVVWKARGSFTVEVSPETLNRTNFKQLQPGDPVNLELPLRLQDRLGGHLVTGHIDGVGVVNSVIKRGEFTFIWFRVPGSLALLLVPKGSVAVDGISLTVNECEKQKFSVAIIPFTMKHTNLRECRVGDRVNIEFDIIGKYVKRLLGSWR